VIRDAFRRLHREETGASLVIALAFLLLFSLILTALLAFSVESFTAGGVVADRERAAYAADAAIDTAVTRMRQDSTMQVGRNGAYAGAQACGLTYHPTDGTPDAVATCNPQTGSGGVRPGLDGPANSILTRSGNLSLSGGPLVTNANVFVNGNIPSGAVTAHDNAVAATGSCGAVFDAVKTYCGATSANTPQYNDGADPAFAVPPPTTVNGVVPTDQAPTCTHGATTFSAGYFTDLTKLTSVASGCSARVFYFQPGVYYVNLQAAATGTTIWSIDGTVVGGTAKGSWWTGTGSPPPIPGAGATTSAACDQTQAGVQFVLVGTAQIQLVTPTTAQPSSIELCPPPSGTLAQRVALFGSAASTGVDVNYADFVACSGSAKANTYTNPQNAYRTGAPPNPFDGLTADGKKINGQSGSDEMDFGPGSFNCSNFPPGVDIPLGLNIQSVQIVAAHTETNTTGAVVTVNESISGLSCTATLPLTQAQTDPGVPCTPSSGVTKTQNGEDFSKHLIVSYIVTGNAATTSHLDGISLRVKFTTGNVSPCSGCTFMSNAAGAAGHAAIWGTVYAPTAVLNMDFGNSQNIVFNMGVIAQSVTASNLPASGDTNGRFRLGDGSGRTVELISSPISAVRARALVRVVDSQSKPGFLAVVRQWSTAHP
jgi:hypothetical protein